MSNPTSELRVLLAQAANFARRENFADAMARARTALRVATEAGDAAGRALAEQAVASYTASFEAWNASIAQRRALRTENAAFEEKKPLPAIDA